jgi:hypothetical protein
MQNVGRSFSSLDTDSAPDLPRETHVLLSTRDPFPLRVTLPFIYNVPEATWMVPVLLMVPSSDAFPICRVPAWK